MERRAADLLVECLARHGADRLFCVPGESYLALLDALHGDDRIPVTICRHEGGAGMMAVADAKLTGKPSLLAVSRGPGATNASIALHLAEQDAVPMVVLIGQVARWERGRGAFQEVDYTQFFGGIAKGVWEVNDAGALPETVARAYQVAQSGTPGPVVIALPEDMLSDMTDAEVLDPLPLPRTGPDAAALDRVAEMLASAERPLLIAGGGFASAEGRAALAELSAAHDLPVALTFKHQELFDNSSDRYAGHLGFKIPAAQVAALSRADLVLAVGTRLGDTPTQGYRLPKAPVPDQPLIHVWPDPAAIGRVFSTAEGLPCDATLFAQALAGRKIVQDKRDGDWVAMATEPARKMRGYSPTDYDDGLDFGAVALELAKQAPKDAIVTTDSGNFSGWVHRVWNWDGSQQAVGACGGAMGLGVPAAIAACLRQPETCVLGFVGDGGALMTGSELAAARGLGLKPKLVVSDNGTYGTIRLHQERDHPGRISGTDLSNPDFAAWGESFGALGLTLAKGDDIETTVSRFLAHDGPAVLHVKSSAEAISAFITISGLRALKR